MLTAPNTSYFQPSHTRGCSWKLVTNAKDNRSYILESAIINIPLEFLKRPMKFVAYNHLWTKKDIIIWFMWNKKDITISLKPNLTRFWTGQNYWADLDDN